VRLIEAQFPELAPVRLDTVGEGYDNTVYRVNSAYTFRFPRRTIAAKLLQTECALLPALERLGLPLAIPLLRYAGRPAADDAYPWPFAGYSFLPGQPPGPAAAAARARAVEPLALFLRRLHRFPAAEARALGVPGDELGRMDLAKRLRQLDASLEQAQRLGLWPASALPPVLAAIDTVRPLASCIADRPRMLVHGDLHIRNVVADDEGTLTGIIDWGDVHVGDAALDLSIAYSYVPPAERGRFFALYGQEPDETTARLARFFAVYVGFVLLVYGRDRGNEPLVAAARHSIENALLTE
jgi:aminoglycoside phosphotransferase (APT) family kinase protein